MEVGELRQSTIDEHHDICLALVVKLKDKMKKEGETAFAYRKADGTIRYAHGIISDNFDVSGRYFVYFDTDKGEERKFRIDAFIGIGEPEELQNSKAASISETQSAASSTKAYNDFSSLDIKTILATGQDKVSAEKAPPPADSSASHGFTRGAGYYGRNLP